MPRMTRLSIFVALLVVLIFSDALADIIYLRNGRKYVGKVSQIKDMYIVEMSYGTITVDKSDVIYVAYGLGTTRPTFTKTSRCSKTIPDRPVSLETQVKRWDITEATLPDPIVFMLTRQAELLKNLQHDLYGQNLKQWVIAAHDKKRKVGGIWLTREQQRKRRIAFETHLRKGNDLLRQANSIRPRTASDRTKKRRLMEKAEREYSIAVKAFPDNLLGEFLTGILALRHKRYEKAEMHFRHCCQVEPLLAGFHQGRAIALMKLKRPLAALAEFSICVELRDDTFQSLEMLKKALKDTPGAMLSTTTYIKAKNLLERYQLPTNTKRSRRPNVYVWLMPQVRMKGQSVIYLNRYRSFTHSTERELHRKIDPQFIIFSPPYDRIISKQALAIPVSKNVLIVDKNAIADANLIYIRISPGKLVQAKPIRQWHRTGTLGNVPDLPLALIRTWRANFEPIKLAKLAGIKVHSKLDIRAVNLYKQMGSTIRTDRAKVISISKAGKIKLDKTLLPGEVLGAVLMGKSLAGLLTGRIEVETPGCGKSTFIPSAVLAEWLKRYKYSLGRSVSSTYYRGPKLIPDAEIPSAKGQTFLVHILSTEKLPLK